jgi:hypothetical protein
VFVHDGDRKITTTFKLLSDLNNQTNNTTQKLFSSIVSPHRHIPPGPSV